MQRIIKFNVENITKKVKNTKNEVVYDFKVFQGFFNKVLTFSHSYQKNNRAFS